jgi:hypothetical protein
VKCQRCGGELEQATACPFCGHVTSPWRPPDAQSGGAPPVAAGGIPFEVEQNPGTFFETWKLILFSPTQTFAGASPTAPVMPSLIFGMILLVASGFLQLLTTWLFGLNLSEIFEQLPPEVRQYSKFFESLFFTASLASVILIPIGAIIQLVIYWLFFHLCLLIVGGANGRFEDTLRGVSYSQGATALFELVPVVGPLIALVWTAILRVIAFRELHRTDTGRAVFAVLLPIMVFALCCGCAAASMFRQLLGGG